MYIKPQNILFEYIIDSFFQTLHYQICKLQVFSAPPPPKKKISQPSIY